MITQIKKHRLIAVSILLAFIFILFNKVNNARAELMVPAISQEQYDKFQQDNIPTFLAYNATWCSHCRRQDRALFSIREDYAEKAAIYLVNWDDRKKIDIPAPKQRTTIIFVRDNKIVDQLIGETRVSGIREFLDKNLEQN